MREEKRRKKKKDIAKNIPVLPSYTSKMHVRGQAPFTKEK